MLGVYEPVSLLFKLAWASATPADARATVALRLNLALHALNSALDEELERDEKVRGPV